VDIGIADSTDEAVPTDALMQISGDVGNRGRLALLLDLCVPKFDLMLHGIQVGNNLIKANLDLRRTREARAISFQGSLGMLSQS
jgi:hypothetical protein